jgi:hypothetical protein
MQAILPTNARRLHMDQHLSWAGLALGFLDEVDLVRGVVERGDVRLWARDLAVFEDAELGGVEHLARVVHRRVGLGDLGRHLV